MIVLTGTSGGLASVALETILQQNLIPPNEFRLSSRSGKTDSERATRAGVEVRRGDLKDPASLITAFDGAEAVFLVSYPSVGEERFEYHRAAIDAAKAVGVKHVLYTSLTFGGVDGEASEAGVMQAHIRTVQYLKASGLKWTILRYPTYSHLWNNFAGFLRLEGTGDAEVVIPADGPNHWSSRDELGEATAKVLADWKHYENQTINFTGPELLSATDIVRLYSQHTGRQITVRIVGVEEALEYHKQHKSLPAEQEDFLSNWASWHGAMAHGETSFLDPALEKLLGRKPRTVVEMAESLFQAESNALDTKDFN